MVKKYKLTGSSVNQSGGGNFEVVHPMYPAGLGTGMGMGMMPNQAMGIANIPGSNMNIGVGLTVPRMLFPPVPGVSIDGRSVPTYGMMSFNNPATATAAGPAGGAPAGGAPAAPAGAPAKSVPTMVDTTPELQRRISVLESQIKQLIRTKKDFETKLFECEQRGRVNGKKSKNDERELETLRQYLTKCDNKLTECTGELSKCNEQILNKDGTIKVFKEDVKNLNKDIKEKGDKIITLEGNLTAQTTRAETTAAGLRAQLADCNAALARAQTDLSAIQAEVATIQSQLATATGTEIPELRAQLTEARRQLEAKNANLTALTTEKSSLEAGLDVQRTRADTAETRSRELDFQIRTMQEEINSLTRLNGELNGVKAELTSVKAILIPMRDNNTALKAEIGEEKEKIRTIQSEKENCAQELGETKLKLNAELANLAKLRSDTATFPGQLEEAKKKAANIAREKAELTERNTMLEGLNAQSSANIQVLSASKEKLERDARESVENYARLKAEKEALEAECKEKIKKASDLIKKLQEDNGQMGEEHAAAMAELESQLAGLRTGLTAAQTATRASQAETAEARAQIIALQTRIGELTARAEACEQELTRIREELASGATMTTELRRQIELLTGERDRCITEKAECLETIRVIGTGPKRSDRSSYDIRYGKRTGDGVTVGQERVDTATATATAAARAAATDTGASIRNVFAPVAAQSGRGLEGGGGSLGIFDSAVGRVGSISGMPSNGYIAVGSDASMRVGVPIIGNTSNIQIQNPGPWDGKDPSNFLGIPNMQLPTKKLTATSEVKLTYKEPEIKQSLLKFTPNLPIVNTGYNFNFPTFLQPSEKILLNPRESQARLVVESPDSDEIITISGEQEKVKPIFDKLVQDNKTKVTSAAGAAAVAGAGAAADPTAYNITDIWNLNQAGVANAIKTNIPQLNDPNVSVSKGSKIASVLPTMQNVFNRAAMYGPSIRFNN